jgi:hypothetical protein
MKILSKLLCSFILLSGSVSAATIGWGVEPAIINVGDSFSLNISGNNFTSNVDGGGVNFTYDSNVLNVTSVTIDEAVWDFGGAGISTGSIDNVTGAVDGIMVNTFGTVIGSFDVATIQFLAVGAGTSALDLTEYVLNPWASGGTLINPIMENGSLTVATPVPAAIWLFGTGLLALTGIARRKVNV